MEIKFSNLQDANFFLERVIFESLEEAFSAENTAIKNEKLNAAVRRIAHSCLTGGIWFYSKRIFEAMEVDGLIPSVDSPPLQTLYLIEAGLCMRDISSGLPVKVERLQ